MIWGGLPFWLSPLLDDGAIHAHVNGLTVFDAFVEVPELQGRVRQRLAVAQQDDVAIEPFADGNLGTAQGIADPFHLDVVEHFLELQGEVLGQDALMMDGEDEIQFLG